MFVRMVVLLLFHTSCAEYTDEEDFQCTFDGVEKTFCCAFESGDSFCDRVKERFFLEQNKTLSDDEVCCQKVQAIDEFNYEVNDLN